MRKAIYIFIGLCLLHVELFSQNEVNNYKYIVVPNQYDFQRSDDQYQLNSLTKFLFNKYGFEAYLEDEDLPSDVSQNRCLALKADLKKLKGFLITRLQFELIDCNGNVVSTSKVGETKVKQYDTAYNIALRQAFETYQNMNYSYQPKTETKTPVVIAATEANKTVDIAKSQIEETPIKVEEVKTEATVEKIEVAETITSEEMVKEPVKTQPQPIEDKDSSWYANPIDNGFKVSDASNKVIMTLLYSGATDVYIVKDENAIVYKKDGYWVYSSNNGNGIKVNRIALKF